MNRNRTYKDVAQQALVEYAETVMSVGDYRYGQTAKSIGASAWDAMIDALVEVGADLHLMDDFLDTVVEDYIEDPWAKDQPTDNAAALRQAAEILLKVAESL